MINISLKKSVTFFILEMNKLLDRMGDYEPNMRNDIIRKLIFKPKNKDHMCSALKLYCLDEEEGINKYGLIGLWDVSNVTDMNNMFWFSEFNLMVI